MNKTGIMAAALALALALPFAAAIDFKYELIETGKYADGIKITEYTGSGKTVTYPAEIEGYPVLVIVGASETNNRETIVIPEGVREISGFWPNTVIRLKDIKGIEYSTARGIRSISLPSTLEVIGDGAFSKCTSLTSIDLSRCTRLTTIGSSAFASSGLTSIDLSRCASLTTIGTEAFSEAKNLQTVQLPDSVTEIGKLAFVSCVKLTSVNLPASIKSIKAGAFVGCGELSKLSIPERITAIEFGYDGIYRVFNGSGKLPIATRKRLQALGYKDGF